MNTFKLIRNSILSAITFFGTILLLSVGYAAWNGSMSHVNSGDTISYSSWNTIVDNILNLDSRVTSLSSAGKVLNVTVKNDCARVVMGSSPMTMTSFTVDKKSPTSILLIQGSISGHGNYSGDMTQGWKYGNSTEAIGQTLMYEQTSYSKVFPTSAVITGYATTGPQTMTFRYFAANGATAEKPFLVYNPNSSDEPRMAQTCSVYTVTEVEQ